MVADATVVTNAKEVKISVQKASKKIKPSIQKALAQATAFEISAIKDRTFKGIDAFGSNFIPYSKEYAFFRRKKGRQAGFVDLNFSGQMFSSLTSKILPSKGYLFFRQAEANKKAFYNDEAGVGKSKKRRQFFSISEREEVAIQKLFEDVIKRIKL